MSNITMEGSAAIGWLNRECGFEAQEDFYYNPEIHEKKVHEMQDYLAERFPDYELNFFESNLVNTYKWDPKQISVGAIQPNMIVGVVAGSKFVIPGDKDPDIEVTPLIDMDEEGLKKLNDINWEESHPISLFLNQIDELQAKYGDSRPIIPPLFWDPSGRATIHGPVTTAQKFMGERFYIEMVENEEFAHKFLDWIANSYIYLCRLFADKVGMKIIDVHIGECSGCMLSPEHYEEFSNTYSQKIIDALAPGRVHSCGLSDHLLDPISKIKNLSCFNTGSNTSVANIRELLGKEFRVEIAPDAEMFCFGSTDDMKKFVDNTLEENDGGNLGFVYHMDAGYPLENMVAFHERLIESGAVPRGRMHKGAHAHSHA